MSRWITLAYVDLPIASVWVFSVLAFYAGVICSQQDDPVSRFRHQRRYHASRVDCQKVTDIVFVGFFPCVRDDSNLTAPEKLNNCDLLVEAAAYLAVDRVNNDRTILSNITLRLLPIYTSTNEVLNM